MHYEVCILTPRGCDLTTAVLRRESVGWTAAFAASNVVIE